jgi:tetratricopeptide (TPR) repeat protein
MKNNLENTINTGIEALQAGKFKDAQSLFQTALKLAESGQNKLLVATCLDQLGETFFQQGKYEQAEPYYLQAYQLRRQLLTPGHEEIVTSLNNLSTVYFFQGKHKLARPLCEQLMAIYETVLGKEHPEMATCMINMGLIAMAEGRFGHAEKYYKNAHNVREAAFGQQHVLVGNSLSHLGDVYLKQGSFAEATDSLRRALAILEKHLGGDHPDLEKILSKLIKSLEGEGKSAEAEKLYPRLASLKEISLGPTHPEVVAGLEKVAALYLQQGRSEEAARLYQRLLAMKRHTYDDSHPEVARQLTHLAFVQQAQKQPAQAEPLLLKALHIYEQDSRQPTSKRSPVNTQFLTALQNLASFYDSGQRFSKSEKEWRRLIELTETQADKYPDFLIQGYEHLADCLAQQNKNDEAQSMLRKALQFQQSTPGGKQAVLLTKLANLLKQSGQYMEAELNYQQALDQLIKALGPEHQDLAPTMEGYADLLVRTYREAEAENMLICARNLTGKKQN